MNWYYDLQADDEGKHWMIDYILKYKHPFEPDSPNDFLKYLMYDEIYLYPELEIVDVFKCFKHANGSLHYFSLSNKFEVAEFFASKDLELRHVDTLYHRDFPHYRLKTITLENQATLYCLPRIYMP